jgi:acyl carrier protein
MTDIKATIREFVLSNYLQGEPPETLGNGTPLQTSGILDSMAVLGLAEFIQREFGIELDVYDVSPESFDRIDDIAAVIARKQALQQTTR